MKWRIIDYFNNRNRIDSLINKGTRSSIRWKVNDSMITGITFVDTLLPVGRGQRQLIIGDRTIGKTSIFIMILIISSYYSYYTTINSLGSKRLLCIYIGINQNLSKIYKLMNYLYYSVLFIILSTHSSSTALLSFIISLVGISIIERLRDRGFDCVICYDDCIQHAKSYRQISLILSKIPSRDAYSADIFNIHASILERSSGSCIKYGSNRINDNGSITSFPVIETINSNISDFIATNIISITDGQIYLDRKLFLDNIRPSIDSALSVSRIGSSAQSQWIKKVSSGIKNTITYLRKETQWNTNKRLINLLRSLNIIYYSYHLMVNTIEISLILLLSYNCGIMLESLYKRSIFEYGLFMDWFIIYYVVCISYLIFNEYLRCWLSSVLGIMVI